MFVVVAARLSFALMPSADSSSRPATIKELLKRYPVDDRAKEVLKECKQDIQDRVLREFKPNREGEKDYSALMMTFIKRLKTPPGSGRPGPYSGGPINKTVCNREKTCPFLLRIFQKMGGFHGLDAFKERGKEPVDNELQVYTWPDVTLRELVDLVKDVEPAARESNARLQFKLVYPDKTGKNVQSDLGTVCVGKPGSDDNKQLSASKFQQGDLVDLAIFV